MRTLFLCVLAAGAAGAQELAVVDPVLSHYPGSAPVAAGHEFRAGDYVNLRFRVAGMRMGDRNSIFLEYTVQPVDCLGNPFEEPLAGRMIATARNGESSPIAYSFQLPPAPWPEHGSFRITLNDRLGEALLHADIPFQIADDFPAYGSAFSITGFRFFSSEFSDQPMAEATFQPGDRIWGRFFLSGFGSGQNNRYRLSYGVSLRDSNGRNVFAESQAVSESRESFYPRWHVPGVINVRLESIIRTGTYTLQISATDEIGKRKSVAAVPFRVR